jgi:hypothetical protein
LKDFWKKNKKIFEPSKFKDGAKIQDVHQTLVCLHPKQFSFDIKNKDTDLFVFKIASFLSKIQDGR